ncbi:hypothetical protein INR49_002791 [Caranx melampygus]|nr:hypothetical protein INR49_002791 [Caranx melampygus]
MSCSHHSPSTHQDQNQPGPTESPEEAAQTATAERPPCFQSPCHVTRPPAAAAGRHFDLKTESQSRGSDPAVASADLGMDGKKDCIFCLNSDNWRRQRQEVIRTE